jgi:hypothetical protein
MTANNFFIFLFLLLLLLLGIYDELIILNDYPYLNNKMEFVFNETASDVMKGTCTAESETE